MKWIDFWHAIQYLFEQILFVPLDWLRELQFESWWGANIISWIFISIFFVFLAYWMKKIIGFKDEERENGSHSDYSNHPEYS